MPQPYKIYIVEDDPVTRTMLIDSLQEFKYQIISFETGEACLDHLDPAPDAIVLDFYLDKEDKDAKNGLEILKQIKAKDSKIPVIMLSSQESYSQVAQTISKGALYYIQKGETAFDELKELLNKICS